MIIDNDDADDYSIQWTDFGSKLTLDFGKCVPS